MKKRLFFVDDRSAKLSKSSAKLSNRSASVKKRLFFVDDGRRSLSKSSAKLSNRSASVKKRLFFVDDRSANAEQVLGEAEQVLGVPRRTSVNR